MKLSIGIVGLPNVGKSTLFKLLTKQEVNIANYPFATIDPNVGIVTVPDVRLDKLNEMSKSKKKIPAVVEFYDIAGLVKGANKGEGLGNQFLSHIREVNAIVHVVRCFGGGDIIHVEGGVNPIRDIEIIETELLLKDLETVEKAYAKAEGEARSGKKELILKRDKIALIKKTIEEGKFLSSILGFVEEHEGILKEINLLTTKRVVFLLNGSESDVGENLKREIRDRGADFVVCDLSNATSLNELILHAYSVLNLISFFTTGEDETRAWTIERGFKAPQAAGTIHTDFESKFIRLEVVAYDDFVITGGWSQAKQKGKLRAEGKEYVVRDGDVVVVRHS